MTPHDQETPKPFWWKRTIRRPANQFERDAVLHVQRVLRCDETGEMDQSTISSILGIQHLFGLNPTGVIDEPLAKEIDRLRTWGSIEGG